MASSSKLPLVEMWAQGEEHSSYGGDRFAKGKKLLPLEGMGAAREDKSRRRFISTVNRSVSCGCVN
ncbi:hypothetical protein E2562_033222 [Oryza meyeriana var. granulata]|uniref:Uncharacterized protein n=1 Tax=Oryza meyeriana var. granulata TaxID=110450 RepID=A0A6G1BPR7_9ORYZ|nr:hypothetical protein E2562_033222 [Oryza meyeriana var. granulata]